MRESGENYLETIYLLQQKNGKVRSIDIANELNYAKPSVSRAVGILKQNGLITVGMDGYIDFTDRGRAQAEAIYERHEMITDYLVQTLHIPRDVADADACRIEHIISEETFDSIKIFVNKYKKMFAGQ